MKGENEINPDVLETNLVGDTPLFVGQCASKVLWSPFPVEAGDGEPCHSKDKGY